MVHAPHSSYLHVLLCLTLPFSRRSIVASFTLLPTNPPVRTFFHAGTFFLSEAIFHVSGVLAVVTAGLLMAWFGKYNISPHAVKHIEAVTEVVSLVSESAIFFFAGIICCHPVNKRNSFAVYLHHPYPPSPILSFAVYLHHPYPPSPIL